VRGVLEDEEAVPLGEIGNGGKVARLAGEVHRHDDAGQRARRLGRFEFSGEGVDTHAVRAGVDVDEVDVRGAVPRAVRGRDERVRRGPEQIAFAEASGDAGGM
jgi:hypothetical protein